MFAAKIASLYCSLVFIHMKKHEQTKKYQHHAIPVKDKSWLKLHSLKAVS